MNDFDKQTANIFRKFLAMKDRLDQNDLEVKKCIQNAQIELDKLEQKQKAL